MQVVTVRKKVDVAAVPHAGAEEAVALCTQLFGDRFVPREGLLAIALSNLNPQNHLAIGLMNLTRMERGELWHQGENVIVKRADSTALQPEEVLKELSVRPRIVSIDGGHTPEHTISDIELARSVLAPRGGGVLSDRES